MRHLTSGIPTPNTTVTQQQHEEAISRVSILSFASSLMAADGQSLDYQSTFLSRLSKALTMTCNDSPTDTKIAVAALAVALVALFAASGQLLGQYFATADGYRRCQPSVMGPWAKRTRLRWRWSQFRFETLFTTPEILFLSFSIDQHHRRVPKTSSDDIEWIMGSPTSQEKTMVVSPYVDSRTDEMVCWLPLLRSLHRHEWELQRLGCYNGRQPSVQLAGPAIRFRERSWDFMPVDIVRPHAITNVSDIAVLARRLGPEDGVMRAEGNGHVISSTLARSIGIILQYMYVGVPSSPKTSSAIGELLKAELYVPSTEADMMGFGILPGCEDLQLPTFKMGTIEEVYTTMNILDPTRKASRKLRDVRGIEPHCTFGFSDLIPLAAPMMHSNRSSVIRLPIPTEYCVGLTCHNEGFVIFHNRLKEYMAETKYTVSGQTKWVLDQYEMLKAQYLEWENEALANDQVNDRNQDFLQKSHACWDTATEYFINLQQTNQLQYYDLMASHITHAVNYWGDAWSNIREGTAREHYGLRPLIAEGMHMYWDYVPDIVVDLRNRGFEGEDALVHEAWFTMMFRAFCWWRCHFLHVGDNTIEAPPRLPSRYWGSKLPVYIG
ncbi:MAG: hypothetical protein M1830_001990 [Pleopsidium flavum]|nr:MAG: hypothetical protein M1830_001990 [Pleopsidium flavum]